MTRAERLLALLTVAGLVIVPTIFLTGVYDYFRVIKEVAFRAEAILAVFFLGVAIIAGGTARLREMFRDRAAVALTGCILVWSILTTLVSTNRMLSSESLVTGLCSVALFVAVWYASPSVPVPALLVLVPVAVVNSVVAALQEYGIWNVFDFTVEVIVRHLSTTAFIGNPNDVGAYLALCMVVLLTAAAHLRRWQRWTALIAAVVALAGVFVSQARTAVIAAGAALFVLAIRRSLRTGIAIIVLAMASLVAATFIEVPVLSRLIRLREHAASRDWNVATSGRVVSSLAAFEMFRERPLVGQGPGTYGFHYLRHYESLALKYPANLIRGPATFSAEAHNDHLQVLAELGIVGYVFFLAALALIAGGWRNAPQSASESARAANTLGPPLACATFVLALAFFPLQIAATRHLLITAAALVIGWRNR